MELAIMMQVKLPYPASSASVLVVDPCIAARRELATPLLRASCADQSRG
jgi:hypothetical protein